jgi:hypothetical protein
MTSSSKLTLQSPSPLYMELGNRIYEDAIKIYLNGSNLTGRKIKRLGCGSQSWPPADLLPSCGISAAGSKHAKGIHASKLARLEVKSVARGDHRRVGGAATGHRSAPIVSTRVLSFHHRIVVLFGSSSAVLSNASR